MAAEQYKHLTEEDIKNTEDISELLKNLDPVAQQMIYERACGMKQMQDIMEKKSA